MIINIANPLRFKFIVLIENHTIIINILFNLYDNKYLFHCFINIKLSLVNVTINMQKFTFPYSLLN